MRTKADVQQLMERIFHDCQGTREQAQKEYAHDEANALGNFERTGVELELAREKVWYIFAKKHWDGVLAWITGHRSQREDVRGRIKDLIVYLVLLWAMVDDNEESEAHNIKLEPSLGDRRRWMHQTYNGGYQEEKERAIFHHGMDTALNVVEKGAPN